MLTPRLVDWYLHADRRGASSLVIPMAQMREAIVEAAEQEEWQGQYPWETGAEYDERRSTRGATGSASPRD